MGLCRHVCVVLGFLNCDCYGEKKLKLHVEIFTIEFLNNRSGNFVEYLWNCHRYKN